MKERPILMSAPMVRAILDERKSQTRRVLKDTGLYAIDEQIHGTEVAARERAALASRCPYGVPGDLLWVRESCWQRMGASGSFEPYYYDASVTADEAAWFKERPHVFRRRPSIHMPRWASRITLRITDARVERLNDISNEDAAAEGWPGPDEENTIASAYPMAWYSRLWDSINGAGSWDLNPWVWAVSFERVLKHG